ncbi:MAG: hypothetical protein KC561_13840, partial [Myxococcales bacterium]|nr:hypothetical protein [Myxococcales bacterium]
MLVLCVTAAHARAETFTVSSPLDDGEEGTLRWALEMSESEEGQDLIAFDLPADELTITLSDPLPTLSEGVEIRGTTQFEDGPLVTVSFPGSNGFRANLPVGDDLVINGLVLQAWGGVGIEALLSGGDVSLSDLELRSAAGCSFAANSDEAIVISGANEASVNRVRAVDVGMGIRVEESASVEISANSFEGSGCGEQGRVMDFDPVFHNESGELEGSLFFISQNDFDLAVGDVHFRNLQGPATLTSDPDLPSFSRHAVFYPGVSVTIEHANLVSVSALD